MTLTTPTLIKIDEGTRSNHDHRKRVDRYTVAYTGDDGYEYRRIFEVKPGDICDYPKIIRR